MDQKALFLKFWEKEAPATRKVISRIPQERSDYRADPKARTAREIAWLIVREEIVLGEGLEKGALDWVEIPTPATVKEILEVYDRHHDAATRRLRAADAARWEGQVPFKFQGHEVYAASGYDQAWGFLLDVIHHRGQLSTYLRPMGSTVPQIYGPSADEPMAM
ncbi:MAG: DinB family protein [Vicinamibacterales bacterium]